MPKSLIWLILLCVVIGLFVTTATRSPEKTSPADRKQVHQTTPALTQAPSDGNLAVDAEWLIEPGKRVGNITGASTLADLTRLYGKSNIHTGPVPGPEGTTLDGAVLFPDDPKRALTVIWKEGKKNKQVGNISVTGKETLWHTVEGITLGTPLKELEIINGSPFTLSGFDWDYGGTVLSWGDTGKLRERFQTHGGLVIRLSPPQQVPEAIYSQVAGDKTYSSHSPAMQQLDPKVSEILVMF